MDNIYQKAKIKNLEQSWNFKNTTLKKRRRKKIKEREKKSNKNYKIYIYGLL